ncbi:transposase, partial [Synechococcus sp. R3-13]|uniref:transposase n=1 Tax=Synechococcus sp. R3-13 TaxID=2421316 RepID=UPI0039C19F04
MLAFLRTEPHIGKEAGCKRFIEGVLWMARSGSPWRYLPERCGKWYTVYPRFHHWSRLGVWERMFQFFITEP